MKQKRKRLRSSRRAAKTRSVDEIIDAIKSVTGMDIFQYTRRDRRVDGFYYRMILAHHMSAARAPVRDIATAINRNRTTVYYCVKKYADEVKYNHIFRLLAERVENKLKDDQ
jgi:hypothetical protein